MELGVKAGYKTNIDGNSNEFAYIEPVISINYPLVERRIVVLATKISGKALIGDSYEFYHGAVLGGNNSLRGYRNERFNGKKAYYQTTDLLIGIGELDTNFMSLRYGITGGFDYGRVWLSNDTSGRWHNSYGGSIWLMNAFSAISGNIGLYHSDESNRLIFTFGFKF